MSEKAAELTFLRGGWPGSCCRNDTNAAASSINATAPQGDYSVPIASVAAMDVSKKAAKCV